MASGRPTLLFLNNRKKSDRHENRSALPRKKSRRSITRGKRVASLGTAMTTLQYNNGPSIEVVELAVNRAQWLVSKQ